MKYAGKLSARAMKDLDAIDHQEAHLANGRLLPSASSPSPPHPRR